EKKQLNARGVNIKLKLKNFQTLQHSKSFKNPIHSQQDLIQVLFLLLNEMHIPENFQFRLIGIGVYQLQTKADDFQLSLW
ncbi:MAG: DNA polymerase IV, partial [Acinetobacter baumannii]